MLSVHRKRIITITAIVLIIAYILYNLTDSRVVKYVCNGRYSSVLNGQKDIKENAIFGIKIDRYNNLFGKGAYVYTTMMLDISDQGWGSTSVRYYIVEEGKGNPSISDGGMEMTQVEDWTNKSQNEGVVILISGLTQTLHFVERKEKGRSIQSFDGNCRELK